MVRIRLLTGLATMTRVYDAGWEGEWDRTDAQRLVKAGYAEIIDQKERK